MLDARIQQQFFDSADWLNQTAEPLGRPLATAAQALLGCITAGAKVMVLGERSTVGLAQYFVQTLMGRLDRERPPLAAMVLSADLLDAPAGPPALTLADAQLRALAQPGDVLVALLSEPPTRSVLQVLSVAQDKDLTLVVLAARPPAALHELLREADVMVPLPTPRVSRSQELLLLSLHCLVDAIETQLLGEQDSP